MFKHVARCPVCMGVLDVIITESASPHVRGWWVFDPPVPCGPAQPPEPPSECRVAPHDQEQAVRAVVEAARNLVEANAFTTMRNLYVALLNLDALEKKK